MLLYASRWMLKSITLLPVLPSGMAHTTLVVEVALLVVEVVLLVDVVEELVVEELVVEELVVEELVIEVEVLVDKVIVDDEDVVLDVRTQVVVVVNVERGTKDVHQFD